ncbi:hypothetical protein GCM10018793_31650 [Streptomyces sulfonofaciens]|uniref:DUF6351 domain-containing protein n=1 Tax=Streptomyces sulfonofaciens TaxID=68272 RepID=A0A919L0D9_9ACTN|nr:hypothetical protein GCM10018793_31650 [Streptomyces sulfonofaciens]
MRIDPPNHGAVRVTADGHIVSDRFTRQGDGSLLGLVTGLRPGENLISATAGGQAATLTVIDHPRSGPVFAGPQQHPFYCETTAFGLSPSTQPLCSAPTVVSYEYRTTGGAYAPLADPGTRPKDLATATVDGRTVPYVVRVETGTIDRAVYQIAALYDGSAPSPLRPDHGWNQRLVYTFGGGCNGGYHQGNTTGGVLNDLFLSQGYAVASSSLNVLENNCSTILSAEAAMMVKEHFINTYGPVAHTIGWGGSGGSIQQYDIADAYPGILDGIVPGFSFPDPFTVLNAADDCRLLVNFFKGTETDFTAAQRQAVAGFPSYGSCTSWDSSYANRNTASDSCNKEIAADDSAIPPAAIWNRTSNPTGVKCAAAEQYANQLGRDPRTGMVRSQLDNEGVQYGLAALRHRQITAAQFVALNTAIGGFDAYGAPVPQRSKAHPKALKAVYRDDILVNGGLGLATTPIIDQRVDLDLEGPLLDIHTTQWSSVMRARLRQANGTSANQVIIDSQYTPEGMAAANSFELAAMDEWLTRIAADHSTRSRQAKVTADKPRDLGDGCYLSPTHRVQAPITDPATGPCAAQYPVGADPRQQAGEPLAENTLKCALRPLDFADYPVRFTRAQRAQLRRAFPTGVCDYGRPGVGQVRPAGTWLDYSQTR